VRIEYTNKQRLLARQIVGAVKYTMCSINFAQRYACTTRIPPWWYIKLYLGFWITLLLLLVALFSGPDAQKRMLHAARHSNLTWIMTPGMYDTVPYRAIFKFHLLLSDLPNRLLGERVHRPRSTTLINAVECLPLILNRSTVDNIRADGKEGKRSEEECAAKVTILVLWIGTTYFLHDVALIVFCVLPLRLSSLLLLGVIITLESLLFLPPGTAQKFRGIPTLPT
jgi:hypothetical protein